MSEAPLVSIVTPSYNQAAFLEQTLRSVLQQDYPNLEYLVVDGGSTDGSVEIIRRYSDRLAWQISEKDNGQADAINKGLRRARGEYVAWLNSDDCYLPGAVSAAVRLLQAHPEAGLVYGDVYAVDAAGRRTNRMRYRQWGLKDLLCFRILGQPGVFMRRAVLEQAGYLDLSYHFLLDHHLWVRMSALAPMVYAGQAWAEARYHEQAKNVARAAEFGAEAFRILDWAALQPEIAPTLQRCSRSARAGAERFNARYLLDAGREVEAWQGYIRALKLDWREALLEWKRILYIPFARLGLRGIKERVLARRRRRFSAGKEGE